VAGSPLGSCFGMDSYHSACAEGQIGALGDMDGDMDGNMDGETCPSPALMMEKPQTELGR
jgi:hypothetical protein